VSRRFVVLTTPHLVRNSKNWVLNRTSATPREQPLGRGQATSASGPVPDSRAHDSICQEAAW